MPVYYKFDNGDILYSVIHAQPRLIFASGTLVSGSIASGTATIIGWRGNTGPSASLSLYEGVRSRNDVDAGSFPKSGIAVYPLDSMNTYSIDGVIFVSGSYPATGSVRFVKIRRAAASNVLTGLGSQDWYEEHFSPILNLFDYYSQYRDGFFTGSYDYYSLYFEQDLSYNARATFFSGTTLPTLSGAFTMGAWIKPTRVTSSLQDFTIQSQRARWKFYITGSSGKLAWTDFGTVLTSSTALSRGLWYHVAFVASSGSASFYINAQLDSKYSYTGSLAAISGALALTSSYLTVGAEVVMSQTLGPGVGVTSSAPQFDRGFAGFIFESRIWQSGSSQTDLTGNFGQTLRGTDSGSAYLLHYTRFNDGPIGTNHGFTAGSGAFEYGRAGIHGQFKNFLLAQPLARHPSWQPNDNTVFISPKTAINNQIDMFKAVHVPSMFYGRQIATGSVDLVCNAYNNQGLVRRIVDDGRGSLYMSGAITRPITDGDYRGVKWNKVGNVFYTEGLIVITDPSLLDFGTVNGDWNGQGDLLQIRFDGEERISTKVFMCRLGQGQGNASNNPTFSKLGDLGPDGKLGPSDGNPYNDQTIVKQGTDEITTWITAVGLYNEDRQLVAIAKLAQPIRKRERDKLDIRLKMDF